MHKKADCFLLLGLCCFVASNAVGEMPTDGAHRDREYEIFNWRSRQGFYGIDFSPDGTLLAAGSGYVKRGRKFEEGQVTVWDVNTGDAVFQDDGLPRACGCCHFSPDGRFLAVTCGDRSTLIYRIDRAGVRRKREVEFLPFARLRQPPAVANPNGLGPFFVRFSPNGKLLACTNHAHYSAAALHPVNGIRIWDATRFRDVKYTLKPATRADRGIFSSPRFMPDGDQLLATKSGTPANPNAVVQLWDLKSQGVVEELSLKGAGDPGHRPEVDISADGQLIAASAIDYIAVLDATNFEELRRFEGHTKEVTSICLSGKGRLLASCAKDDSLRVWDVRTSEQVAKRKLPEVSDRVLFSPDATRLASVCLAEDGVRVWNVRQLINGAVIDEEDESVDDGPE